MAGALGRGPERDTRKPATFCAGRLEKIGGAEEDRTPDLCIANAALSQLSYRPMKTMLLERSEKTRPVRPCIVNHLRPRTEASHNRVQE